MAKQKPRTYGRHSEAEAARQEGGCKEVVTNRGHNIWHHTYYPCPYPAVEDGLCKSHRAHKRRREANRVQWDEEFAQRNTERQAEQARTKLLGTDSAVTQVERLHLIRKALNNISNVTSGLGCETECHHVDSACEINTILRHLDTEIPSLRE